MWYRDAEEWNFFRAQVQSIVHVEFPRWIELLLNITERFTFAGMSETFRTCQLYDDDSHQWLTFEGWPTTPARRSRPASE